MIYKGGKMSDNNIESLAQSVAGDLVKQERVEGVKAFDPMMIMVIIQVISFILSLFKKKNPSPASIQNIAKRSNLLQRAIIKSRLRRYMLDNSNHYDTYENYKEGIVKHVINRVANTKTDDISKIMSGIPSISDEYLG
jgi:hypothetical protein